LFQLSFLKVFLQKRQRFSTLLVLSRLQCLSELKSALKATEESNPINRRFRERKSHHRLFVNDPSVPVKSFADIFQAMAVYVCQLLFCCVQFMGTKKQESLSKYRGFHPFLLPHKSLSS
jgi:hypothetical protein